MFDSVIINISIIIIIIIQIMFLSIRGKEQSREAEPTVIPLGQEEETSICQRGNKYANTAGRTGGVLGGEEEGLTNPRPRPLSGLWPS